MSVFHNLQVAGQNHIIHNFEYLDEAAMNAATGLTSDDLYKIAKLTNNSLWMLTTITPTWIEISGSSSVAAFTDLTDVPASYVGSGGMGVFVNVGETGLEFAAAGGGDHEVEDAVTNAVTSVVTWTHNSSGTPAAGFGTGLLVNAETNTTPDIPIGALSWRWETATHASRRSSLNLYTYDVANKVLGGVINAPSSYSSYVGNSRGAGSVDFQTARTAATQVASGIYSAMIGGSSNTIGSNGDYSAQIGGSFNEIQEGGSVILAGYGNISSAPYTTILASKEARANKWGQVVRSSESLYTPGDAQASLINVSRQVTHTGSSWYELFTRPSASLRLTLASNQAMAFHALLLGNTAGLAKSFGFEIIGVIKNDGGTTSLLSQSVTTLYKDDADFNARASADDTNDALLIEVQDSSSGGDVVKWHGTITTTEVTF